MPQIFSENKNRKWGRPLQKLKNHLIYYSARLLMFFIALVPCSLASRLGCWFGTLVFGMAGGERRKTLNSIRTAFPKDFSEDQVEKLGLSVWRNLGRNLFEFVQWVSMTQEEVVSQVVRIRGWEHLEKAIARGKGIFVVTGHLGNWELLGAYMASKHPMAAVAQKLYDPRFDQMITRLRSDKLKGQMIKRGMALRGILEALKQNKIVYALVDQDTGSDGVFVPFFGKPAWTQSGVARIAQKTGAVLIPAFVVRGPDRQYELHMERAIQIPDTGDKEKDVVETVRRYTEVIEAYVKAYPDQWMWMHQRWKTRPKDER